MVDIQDQFKLYSLYNPCNSSSLSLWVLTNHSYSLCAMTTSPLSCSAAYASPNCPSSRLLTRLAFSATSILNRRRLKLKPKAGRVPNS